MNNIKKYQTELSDYDSTPQILKNILEISKSILNKEVIHNRFSRKNQSNQVKEAADF